MASVYVAGPVVYRPRGLRFRDSLLRFPITSRSILRAYETLEAVARERRLDMFLPKWDRGVDLLRPDRFTDAIGSRIRSADAVITFLLAGDQSASVEATIAAFARKPQLIVARDTRSVPRLIAGLPSVVSMIEFRVGPAFQGAVLRFLDELPYGVGSA